MNSKRLGFFGGCFNPPTIAHFELAKKAIEIAKLDELFFIPMGNCYPKNGLIDIKYRYEMLKLLAKQDNRMKVSDMQFNQKEISYAIDSFELIDNQYPQDEKYFIMGDDNFSQLENWKFYDKLKKYKFIVFERNNTIEKHNDNVIVIETGKFKDISSYEIRLKFKQKDNNINGITQDIFKYVQENKLYQ